MEAVSQAVAFNRVGVASRSFLHGPRLSLYVLSFKRSFLVRLSASTVVGGGCCRKNRDHLLPTGSIEILYGFPASSPTRNVPQKFPKDAGGKNRSYFPRKTGHRFLIGPEIPRESLNRSGKLRSPGDGLRPGTQSLMKPRSAMFNERPRTTMATASCTEAAADAQRMPSKFLPDSRNRKDYADNTFRNYDPHNEIQNPPEVARSAD